MRAPKIDFIPMFQTYSEYMAIIYLKTYMFWVQLNNIQKWAFQGYKGVCTESEGSLRTLHIVFQPSDDPP